MANAYVCEQWETQSSVAHRLFRLGMAFDRVKFQWESGPEDIFFSQLPIEYIGDVFAFDSYVRRVGLPTWAHFGVDGILCLESETVRENQILVDGDEDTEIQVYRYSFVEE